MELSLGQTTAVGVHANQRLNLTKLGRPKEERPTLRTGPWEIWPSGIIGGPRENVVMAEMCTHLATERARLVTSAYNWRARALSRPESRFP
jgi:hypothetical protein